LTVLLTVLSLLVVLGVLIFVHELGHFLAAKWAGSMCTASRWAWAHR
jgi:regulator of sigma E protease